MRRRTRALFALVACAALAGTLGPAPALAQGAIEDGLEEDEAADQVLETDGEGVTEGSTDTLDATPQTFDSSGSVSLSYEVVAPTEVVSVPTKAAASRAKTPSMGDEAPTPRPAGLACAAAGFLFVSGAALRSGGSGRGRHHD